LFKKGFSQFLLSEKRGRKQLWIDRKLEFFVFIDLNQKNSAPGNKNKSGAVNTRSEIRFFTLLLSVWRTGIKIKGLVIR
jgi:hypothetical protein